MKALHRVDYHSLLLAAAISGTVASGWSRLALALPLLASAAVVVALVARALHASRVWVVPFAVCGFLAAVASAGMQMQVQPHELIGAHAGATADKEGVFTLLWAVACGLLGITLAWHPAPPMTVHLARWSAIATTLVAAILLIVSLLGIDYLYSPRLFPHAAPKAALIALLMALAQWRNRAASPHDRGEATPVEDRIVGTAALVLGLALLVTASVAFHEIRNQIERDKGALLTAELDHKVTLLGSEIQTARLAAAAVAARPSALMAMEALYRTAEGTEAQSAARNALQQIANNVGDTSFSSFVFLDAQGRDVAMAGRPISTPGVLIDLPFPGTQLLWSDGYVLRTNQPVRIDGEVVGQMMGEQPLRNSQRVLAEFRGLGATGEIELCSRQRQQVVCFPSRFNGTGQSRPLATPARMPSDRAVTGEREPVWEIDYRGKKVLAALHPAPELNLGLVAKRDADEVLEPVRRLVEWGFPLLALVVAAAFWLLQRRLKPMARAVIEAKQDAERHAARWSALNQAALDGFVMLKPLRSADGEVADWSISHLNPAAEQLLRLRREDALSLPVSATVHNASASEVLRRCAEVLKTNQHATFESSVERKDTSLRWLHYNVIPFRGDIALTIKDLTARKNAELELAEARERLQLIADSLPALVAHVDDRQVYRFANIAHRVMLGLEPANIVGQSMHEVLSGSFGSLDSEVASMLSTHQGVQFERKVERADGSHFFDLSFVPERGREGQLRGHYVMVVDVTRQRRAEQTARDSERRLQMITDQMPATIAFVDAQHVFRFNNLACEEWFDRPLALITGHPAAEVMGAEAYLAHARAMSEAALTRRPTTAEDTSRRAGPAVLLEVSYIPQFDEQQCLTGFCLMGHDITTTRLKEHQLQQAAYRDELTGLPNRAAFNVRLAQSLQRMVAGGRLFSVAYIDLDYFKQVNDTHGHAAGDELLKAFGQRVVTVLRRNDMVARLGGDEFALVLDDLDDVIHARKVSDHLYASFAAPVQWADQPLHIQASIGLALAARSDTPKTLLARADEALYAAKGRGRNNCVIR